MQMRITIGVLAMALLAGCGEPTPAPTATPAPVVVEVGGAALSLSGQGSAGAASPAGLPAPAATPDALAASNQAEIVVFAPGAAVVARGVVRVYPEADPRAQAMGEYGAAALFTVIEPGGDYAGYPVEISEVRWYRVRAADGLVGWVMADGLEMQEAQGSD